MPGEHLLFITGRLAEPALQALLAELSPQQGWQATVVTLPIHVAALLHVDWILRKQPELPPADRVILPGWVQGDIGRLASQWQRTVVRGPKDLRNLPEFFGQAERPVPELTEHHIAILAEINHAPRFAIPALLAEAEQLRQSGADVIDLGCIPGETWSAAGEATRMLREAGFRVSIDSFDREEVTAATQNGAELVLSVNQSNREWAADLGVELVVIPDEVRRVETLEETASFLEARGVKHRLDPILEPIGFGFAHSLGRYLEVRRRFPAAEILMGVGNLTELTEVDSAGVNLLLASFCEELGIRSLLTTQVANWCRTAVLELDLSRKIAAHSLAQRVLPKHVDPRLLALRDSRLKQHGATALARWTAHIKDRNFRIFAEGGELHLINREGHRHGTDPFQLLSQLGPLDPAHAFYLGYELCKAHTALTLGKNYIQDEALNWGWLTQPELGLRGVHALSAESQAERDAGGEAGTEPGA